MDAESGRPSLALAISVNSAMSTSTVQLSFVPKHTWCALYRNFLRATSLLTLQICRLMGGASANDRALRVRMHPPSSYMHCHSQNDPK